ncbi:hypothetical protein AB0I81_04980 [Nonomuraea sp. NPDC050404]|uniref:ABC transporter substrate-binding protein n=1 Tax=Nonomuraea sp. NPDC050404 TaxID=3155783 RepID=UPI0033CE0699
MTILVCVLGIGGVLIYERYRLTWPSGDGHEELLGLSDGGTFFNDPATTRGEPARTMERINRIQLKIQEENERVADAGGPYVKAVLLMPLTVARDAASAITLSQIEHALQGTYTALIRANQETVFGDHGKVRLQLLLANQGSRQDADRIVDKVLEVSEEEHPLVGVLGLGSSVPNTEKVVRRLGTAGIPMVSAITSADSLTALPLFWSVSPSNIQYARALRHYLDHRKTLKSAIVVHDDNHDPYTNSLFAAYNKELRGYLKQPPVSYVGATIDRKAAPNLFGTVVMNICIAVTLKKNPLDTVLYAGRGADFADFAKALKDRQCKATPLTVLAAATGFASTDVYVPTLKEGNVSVVYATSADSEGWQSGVTGQPAGFQDFLKAYRHHGFGLPDLRDGMAIAHHDELAVLAMVARMGPAVPRAADIPPQFGNLQLAHVVRGASGELSFPTEEGGRAVGRMIPVKQLNSPVLEHMPAGFEPYRVVSAVTR